MLQLPSPDEGLVYNCLDLTDFYSDSDFEDGDNPATLANTTNKSRETSDSRRGGCNGSCPKRGAVSQDGCSPEGGSSPGVPGGCGHGCCAPYHGPGYGYPAQGFGGEGQGLPHPFRLSRKIFTNHR